MCNLQVGYCTIRVVKALIGVNSPSPVMKVTDMTPLWSMVHVTDLMK